MKIAIKCTDGSVQIMTLIGTPNISEVLRKWGDVNPDKYLSHKEMPDNAIPTDREFREAWADITPEPVIDIDMMKARSLHLARIRLKRNAILNELDKQSIKAQDTEDLTKLTEIRVKKQKLRDLPEIIKDRLNMAKTVNDLRNILTDSDVSDILSYEPSLTVLIDGIKKK